MRNFIVILVMISHLSANFAEDIWYDFFGFESFSAGLGIGTSHINVVTENLIVTDDNDPTTSDTGTSYVYSLGMQFYGERLSLRYYDYEEAEDVSINHVMVAFDYFFNLEEAFNPFIGVSIGKFSLQKENIKSLFTPPSNENSYKISSTAYGIAMGFDYVEDSLGFNLRLEYINLSGNGSDITFPPGFLTANIDVDSTYGIYAGFIYKFR